MQADLLDQLQKRIASMKCSLGHEDPVQYVDLSVDAESKFLCEACVQKEGGREKFSELLTLSNYFTNLQHQQSLKRKPDVDLLKETETALAVVEKLREDVKQSLEDINCTVTRHYKEFVDRMMKSAQKGVGRVTSKIQHETERSFEELASIENSLKLYREGGSTSILNDVLDQAMNYASKRNSADNALYDLLCGLEVKDTVLLTHSRLTNFAKKYFPRKVATIKSTRENLYGRMGKEKDAYHRFMEERVRILDGLKSLISPDVIPEVPEEINHRDPSQMGRRKFKGLLKNAKKQFDDEVSPNTAKAGILGKRRGDQSNYDPKAAFERAFGNEKPLSIDKQLSNLSISGAAPKANRLSELLSSKRLVTQDMAHKSSRHNNTSRDTSKARRDHHERNRTGRLRTTSKENQPKNCSNKTKMAEENLKLSNNGPSTTQTQHESSKSLQKLLTPGGYILPETTQTKPSFFNSLSSQNKKLPQSLFKERANTSIAKSQESANMELIKSLKENLLQMQQQAQLKKTSQSVIPPSSVNQVGAIQEKENSRDPRLKFREKLLNGEEEKVDVFVQPSQLGLGLKTRPQTTTN